jgi:serine/threonine protein kinase
MRKMIMGDDGLPEWVDGMEDLKNEVCILEYIAQIEDSRKKYLQKYLQYFDDISPDLVFLILEKYENGVLMEWNEFEANYSFKLRDKDSSSIWTMPPLFARKYIKQISLGISLLKEIGISHRDIKVNLWNLQTH